MPQSDTYSDCHRNSYIYSNANANAKRYTKTYTGPAAASYPATAPVASSMKKKRTAPLANPAYEKTKPSNH